jgi:hypothetical protein
MFLPGRRFVSGIFTDAREMTRVATAAAFAADQGKRPDAVYFTLHPVCDSAIPQRCAGRVNLATSRRCSTTRDGDIKHRALYLIDVDPVRAGGSTATKVECASAASLADRIEFYLDEIGFPSPIKLFAGNGTHLLLRGDGCPAADATWKFFLEHLSAKFSTETVKVDTSVFNPARISRLPGCRNRKGVATVERPHRLSKVVRYPSEWVALSVATLHEFARANEFSGVLFVPFGNGPSSRPQFKAP